MLFITGVQAVLLASPRICEPILRVSIEAPSSMSGVVRQLVPPLLFLFLIIKSIIIHHSSFLPCQVASLRGRVELEEPRPGQPLCFITAMVPAIEAFGMDAKLSKVILLPFCTSHLDLV